MYNKILLYVAAVSHKFSLNLLEGGILFPFVLVYILSQSDGSIHLLTSSDFMMKDCYLVSFDSLPLSIFGMY